MPQRIVQGCFERGGSLRAKSVWVDDDNELHESKWANEFDLLPYRNLSDKTKQTYQKIMRTGNVPLRKWYDKVKSKLHRPGRAKFRAELLERANGKAKAIRLHGISIPKTDIQKMLDVKGIEGDVLTGYSRMALKITKKWDRSRRDNTISIADLYSEAIIGLMHAICYYTREDIQFSTVAYWIMQRRLRAKCNRTTPLSELPNMAVDIRQNYDETRKRINGPARFDEVVEQMRIIDKNESRPLTKGEIQILKGALVGVFSQTSLRGSRASTGEHDERLSDYTSLGSMEFSGLSGSRDWRVVAMRGKSSLHPVFARHEEVPFNLAECMNGVDFSLFEQQVIDRFLKDGSSGWMTRLAAATINPETGKPYTKMSVSYAWKRIIRKLQERCGVS